VRRRAGLLAALALAGAVVAAGCGDNSRRTATVVQSPTTGAPPATGPDATIPTTATPTTPAQTTTAPQADTGGTPAGTNPTATTGVPTGGTQAPADNGGTPAGGEQAPGGAGDEDGQHVLAAFTVAGATITPTQITLPAFLALDIAVTAKGGAQKVTIAAPGAKPIDVGADATGHERLAGLKPGDYTVTTGSGAKATLHVVSGGAPGP
jgi:hypothetical protein